MDDQLATQLASAMTAIAPGDYQTDATSASATFTVKEKFNLLTVPGQIPVVRADVAIDADGLPRGTATLDVSAIETPNAKRDRDLQYARRDEIEIMQLVGAPFAFIRGPFIAEGVLQGGIGALVAIVSLWVVFLLGRGWYARQALEGLGLATLMFLPLNAIAALLLGGMLLGCVGGLIVARTVR